MRQKQMVMAGADTDLSRAADDYLEAVNRLKEVDASIEARKQALITVMLKNKKHTITHNGFRLSFRAGRTVKSTIVLQDNHE